MKKTRGLTGRVDHIVGILHSSWVKAFRSADSATLVLAIIKEQIKLPIDSFVPQSRLDIEIETGLSSRQQFTICKNLKLMGVMETKNIGVNGVAMLHYRIKEDVASKMIKEAERELDKVFYSRNRFAK